MNPENPASPGAPSPYVAPAASVGGPAVPGPLAPLPAHPGTHPMLHHPGQGTPAHQQPGGQSAPQPVVAPPLTAQQHAAAQAHAATQQHSGTHATGAAVPPSAAVVPSPAQQASGEAPVRTSLRSGTHPTGTHATGTHATGTKAAVGVTPGIEEEHGGVLKGLGRFVKHRDGEPPATSKTAGGPRRVRAMLTTVDPWSVMKLAFLLSIAAGVTFVVAVNIVWTVINGMGVFDSVTKQIETLFGTETETSIKQFLERDKIMSVAILLSVVNSFLMTGLATIGSMLYNLVVKLVGGVYVTLTDE